jgi:hypothetical protein
MSKIRHVIYNSVFLQQTVTWTKFAGNRFFPNLLYLFSCTFPPFIAISWPMETEHQYIMSCDWARTHIFVYNLQNVSVTVTLQYNIKIPNKKL